MTQLSSTNPSGRRRPRKFLRRSTWLKTSIVAGSIAATLAGTQAVAWLETGQAAVRKAAQSNEVVAAATPTITAVVALPVAGAEIAAARISIQSLLPTLTPTAVVVAMAEPPAAVIPTDTPVSTTTPTPTATLAPTATPTIIQAPATTVQSLQAPPLTRSRSSR